LKVNCIAVLRSSGHIAFPIGSGTSKSLQRGLSQEEEIVVINNTSQSRHFSGKPDLMSYSSTPELLKLVEKRHHEALRSSTCFNKPAP